MACQKWRDVDCHAFGVWHNRIVFLFFIPGGGVLFMAIVAGIVRMDFRRFILLTISGSIIWIVSFVAAGYFIARQPFLKPWLKYIVLVFILVVTIPLIIRTLKELRKRKEDRK